MYNSTNLPLDRKKIIKKTIENGMWPSIGLIFGVVLVIWGLVAEGGFIFYIGGVLCFVLPLIGVYIYQSYYYKLYYYNFGDSKAEIRKGVIARSTGHVQYARIQNVYVDQDILDRIFGLYDIHYETAGEVSGIYSHVDGLNKENGDKLVEFLNSNLRERKTPQSIPEKMPKPVSTGMASKVNNIATSNEILNSKNMVLSKKYLITAISKHFSIVIGGSLGLIVASVNEGDVEVSSILKYVPYGIIALIIIFMILYAYNWIWLRNFYFEFNNESGVIKTKVVAQSQTFIYYDRVQNININQGFLERLLGISSVIIETAAGSGDSSKLYIPGLPYSKAEKLKDFLLEKVRLYRNNSQLGL